MRLRNTTVTLRSLHLPIPVLVIALTISAVVGLGSIQGPTATAVGVNADTAYANSSVTFTISGSVSGLYPGAALPLVLTVTAPKSYSITVSSITTAVKSQTNGCTSTVLTVSSFSGSLSVPAKQSAQTTVLAQMDHTAPDACQGAKFRLIYSGTGTSP